MSQLKQRTILYLRATWLNPEIGLTLQQALSRCLGTLKQSNDTELVIGLGSAAVRHRKSSGHHDCIHIAAWTPEEQVSTVPHSLSGQTQADLAAVSPDTSWDYLDGDAFILVSDDHCLLMLSGLRQKFVEHYIQKLLLHSHKNGANLPKDIDNFELVSIANRDVTRQIQREGVKAVNLNVGQFMETARLDVEERPQTILQQLSRSILNTLVTKDEDRERIRQAENVQAKLVISIDSRRKGLEPEDLAPIMQEVISESDDDDMEIVTGQGQRIKRGRLLLKKPAKVPVFAKTVHHQPAWDEMEIYMGELRTKGVLDE